MSAAPATLHTKYRPQSFEDFVGHQKITSSLQQQLDKKTQQSFIFHGEPGTGKTTLARLVAKYVGAAEYDITEFNAGSDTGVDAIRDLLKQAPYRGMGDNQTKVFILDEVQMLTKNAWNALLKLLEEPPEWLYWCLCTTELKKVPKAARSRCAVYGTKLLNTDEIFTELKNIAQKEGIPTNLAILQTITECSRGSMRQALTGLGVCQKLDALAPPEEAMKLLQGVEDTSGATEVEIKFCRAIGKENFAAPLLPLLKEITDNEKLRIIVHSYYTKVALNSKNGKQFNRAVAILKFFGQSFEMKGVGPIIVATQQAIKNTPV